MKKAFFFVKVILITILFILIIRIFFVAVFIIPSSSMSPTFLSGDYIVVNKLILGPRMYTKLPSLQNENISVKHLKGIRKVKRNDILVFNDPYYDMENLKFDMNAFLVKRCVAIPGDTFYIKDGIYKVRSCSDTLGCYHNQVFSFKKRKKSIHEYQFNCFPYDEEYKWNINQFGPLYIPGKGDMLKIDSQNIKLYKQIIQYETKKEIVMEKENVYLNDIPLEEYIFCKNYYFMAGDNVNASTDSRYWGLLPEDHIVGKVAIIYKSIDPKSKKRRWERFLKKVN